MHDEDKDLGKSKTNVFEWFDNVMGSFKLLTEEA